jgi:hypothetical protein
LQTCSSPKEEFAISYSATVQIKHLEEQQTYGGYSTSVVVDENLFTTHSENLDEAATTTAIVRRSYYMVTTTSLERKKEIKK